MNRQLKENSAIAEIKDSNYSDNPQSIQAFDGWSDITLDTLEKLKGHRSVSKQFIADLSNASHIKQSERALVQSILEQHIGERIVVIDFAQKVRDKLLPLEANYRFCEGNNGSRYNRRFERYCLDKTIRGHIAAYRERIYQSPCKTSAGSVHFSSGEAPNYFAHTRIEDLGASDKDKFTLKILKENVKRMPRMIDDKAKEERKKRMEEIEQLKQKINDDKSTRRVIEIQSDLFQKGRFERSENLNTHQSIKSIDEVIEGISQLAEKLREAGFESVAEAEKNSIQSLQREKDRRLMEIEKVSATHSLEPYVNIWQDRIIGEEIKLAAKDGITKLQFPTGETAMKIENLTYNSADIWMEWNSGARCMKEDIGVGMTVYQRNRSEGWMVTEILPDGKFKAVSQTMVSDLTGRYGLDSKEVISIFKDGKNKLEETFDLSSEVNQTHSVYRFYEKEIGRYLEHTYGAKLVTDDRSVTWREIHITPELAQEPIMAFGKRFDPGHQLTTGEKKMEEQSKNPTEIISREESNKELQEIDEIRQAQSHDEIDFER